MNTDSSPNRPLRAWVWYCNEASIAAGKISVLAVVEVFSAVGLHWWLMLHFDWPILSLITLIAAPILLLRSPESVKHGVDMLRRCESYKEKDLALWKVIAIFLIATTMTFIFIYAISQQSLQSHVGWALYWRAGVLGAIAGVGAVAGLGGLLLVVVLFTLFGRLRLGNFSHYGVIAVEVAVLCMVVGVIVIVGKNAGFSAGLSAGLGAVLGMIATKPFGVGVFANMIFFIPFRALKLLFLAIPIRLAATLLHVPQGIANMAQNWRETLVVIDLMHPPELLPDAGRVDSLFTVIGIWRSMKAEHLVMESLKLIFIFAWYLPALAYRWSLKASAWLWWPLVLALTPPLQGLDRQGRRERTAITISGALAFPLLLPVVVLAWLAVSLWPDSSDWMALWPEVGTPVKVMLPFLTPPAIGLRYALLWLVPLLAIALWWRRTNLCAAWNNVLGSPKACRELNPDEEKRYLEQSAGLERLRLILIFAVFILGEAFALSFAHSKYPYLVERLVWPWVLQWL